MIRERFPAGAPARLIPMRRLLLVALFAVSLHARDLRPELVVEGRVTEIGLSPTGALWIGTATGRAYHSGDGGRTWSEVELPVRKVEPPEVWLGDYVDRINFFDARRAIVTGYIGEEQDRVLLTGDGGATWEEAKLPDGMWVYDAQTTADGHAWLVGSEGAVLRSDDYGRTWRALAKPFDPDERTMSVWFDSPDAGIVSTLFSGDLATTRDGGRTWQKFEAEGREEVVRGCSGESDRRVTKVRIDGGRVLMVQCGGVWAAALDAPRKWQRVASGAQPLVDFELADDGIIGVTADANVVAIDAEGRGRVLRELERLPMALAVAGERIALLDPTLKVTAFDGETWLASRMFGKGVATSWPIRVLDRGASDVLWGVSHFFLYRSTDGAKTWDRITELPSAANLLLIQRDGNVLLADGHGWVGRWDAAASRLNEVPLLDGLDLVGFFRRADLWLVYGGRQYDTAGRVEVAQTFVAGQFAGSVDRGFVAASGDGGVTWQLIDRWEEGPQALFLSDDNRLTLLSWLGGVRQGRLTREPLAAKMQTLVRGRDEQRAPYVQRALVLDLLDPSRGWLLGWIHHVGNVAWRTSNGGRSWKRADAREETRLALERLFDGTWLAFVPPNLVHRWNGKSFEPFATLPGEPRQAWVDSEGSLTVRLRDDTLVVLDAKSRTFRKLGG